MKNNFKKRKIIMPIVMASIITSLGMVSFTNQVSASTINTPNKTTSSVDGNRQGFGLGRGRGSMGIVQSINGSSITILARNGKTYIVDTSNANFYKRPSTETGPSRIEPMSSNLSEIKIGDTIMVKGTITDNSIKATTVVDRDKLDIYQNHQKLNFKKI